MSFMIRVDAEMAKALNTARLVRKKVSVRVNGRIVERMQWVRPEQASAPARPAAAPDTGGGSGGAPKVGVRREVPAEQPATGGEKPRFGMHNIEKGDTVEFSAGGQRLSGVVTDDTRYDGLVVKTPDGQKHPVAWKDITHFDGATKSKKTGMPIDPMVPEVRGKREPVEPDRFTAAEWKKGHDDPNANADAIVAEMERVNPGTREAMAKAEDRLKTLEQTIANHRISGTDAGAIYSPERAALHKKIMNEVMSPEKIKAAQPAAGEKPAFILLGGRGGSGKSWFKGKVYDDSKAIVLDADAIKGMLPEYEGFNAAQVHEESTDILEKLLHRARALGLNVVLDATMKTAKGALDKVKGFKDHGYQVEAHYMHLPRQEAAKRALARFMSKEKRYVPPAVVLANTTNEDTFDQVKRLSDAWSFRDNNVGHGEQPILISSQGKGRFAKMLKSLWATLGKSINYQLSYKRRPEMEKTNTGKNGLVGPVTPANFNRFDEYDCRPDTADDKVDPALTQQIEEDRRLLGAAASR